MARLDSVVVVVVALSWVSAAGGIAAPCEGGWSFFQPGNKCIKAFGQTVSSWEDAQYSCTRHASRLLVIPDKATNDLVTKTVIPDSSFYFIGLTDLHEENRYLWVDGTKLGFADWASNQPDNSNNEDCVHIRNDKKWNDMPCRSIENRYICEKRGPGCAYQNGGCPDVCTDPTDAGWNVTCSLQACQPGFARENGICYDIDECSVGNGGCDQVCSNTIGSWGCACYTDFRFNGTHCVVGDDDTIIG